MFLPEQVDQAIITKVFHLLNQRGLQSYIVGGFVRDCLLERQTNDVDIAVDGDAVTLAQELARALKGKFVLLDEMNSIARVVITEEEQQWQLDFSSFAHKIELDLARRDFTIDAMAIELGQLASADTTTEQRQIGLIDPFSGEKDLRNKSVRAVSKQIFAEDAARLLRGVRLAAELDFSIEPETEDLIRQYAPSVAGVPGERSREDLLRLLSLPCAACYLRYLDELDLLTALIPELSECKGVEQPTTHFWDVFDHSMQTVAALEFLFRENIWEYGNKDMLASAPWSDALEQHLSQELSKGSSRRALLKLGALLHDIAKPQTKSLDATGRAHFLGHTKQGAVMAEAIVSRLRFGRRETGTVKNLVYHHLHPVQMASEGLPSQRAIYRYFRDTNGAGIDVLFLALADYLASRGPLVDMQEWEQQCRLINYILTQHTKQETNVLPPRLIDGHDLMNIFGLTPGPLLGSLLASVREAQASGELVSREDALALAQRELSKRRKIAGMAN